MSTLSFFGGTGTVTGANFLLATDSVRVLIDCGLIQGDRFAMMANCDAFPYDPKDIDVLLVTHAHADHIGRIPKLVHEGFMGTIYSTEATKDLANVMLRDAYKVMRYEAEKYGSRQCYELEDIDHALALWEGVDYKEHITIGDDVSAILTNAGHILGSAIVTLMRGGRTLVCSGDIGNTPQLLLDPPDVPSDYDYLIMESVYGDRVHEDVSERTELLKRHIERTIENKGTLMIPAFSLERTQGILYEINNLVEKGNVPAIPVFLDSPLAISVTEIYRQHMGYLKEEVREQIAAGDDIFSFPKLKLTKTTKDSESIHKVTGSKIIIAGSGMSHGGRIIGHEQRYLEDKNTTLLLVGYQAVGSLGRQLHDGATKIRIDGEDIKVRATIARIRGYSAHADRDQLLDFAAVGGKNAEDVFVTMGEERSSLFLVQRLRDYLGIHAVAPDLGDVYELDF